uniref:Uncharacterized protein n=1 Tax=Amphimedon queenslandica TaxID=400682 RepID=A0A1X7UBS2_AMPQE
MMSFNPSHSHLHTVDELFFLLQSTGFTDPQFYFTRTTYNIIETYPKSNQ